MPSDLESMPGRIQDNIKVMVVGLIALRSFASNFDVELKEGPFRKGIKESVEHLLNELLEKGTMSEIGLTHFLEALATMAATGRIKRGVHYVTEGNSLYIHLEDCLAEFRRFVRRPMPGWRFLIRRLTRSKSMRFISVADMCVSHAPLIGSRHMSPLRGKIKGGFADA